MQLQLRGYINTTDCIDKFSTIPPRATPPISTTVEINVVGGRACGSEGEAEGQRKREEGEQPLGSLQRL